ncbi:thioredoxin peroxidase [candidate division Kazan bacterium RBG_13_50_9]|uniref:Thioredoxin peroxidase n=1 Tax=candidate division Kazan bacterium RBG_13_50_9 TaxID=1798535 RepID=A0A1F4NTA3_UNCK3|nr:MAG: thioredoxin peroxidase [candidate division Kazan bacterium RBG_13_50_9]
MVRVGSKAPEFALEGIFRDKIKRYQRRDFKGKWLVLFFYPLDFTFVCPTEVTGFNERVSELKKLNADIVGISVDSAYAHKKWVEELGGLDFPLLSDFHKRTARDYQVLIEDEGVALRATFIINPEGIIKYIVESDNDVGRSTDETIRVLSALQTGKLCPINWKPGEATLS